MECGWREFAERAGPGLEQDLVRGIADFNPDVILGVDWSSLPAARSLSRRVRSLAREDVADDEPEGNERRSLIAPFVYSNFRVFTRGNAPEAHAALNDASMRDEATKEARLNAAGFGAPLPALLGAGDCLLMDSRCIHRGGANSDTRLRRRALMYASFAVPYNAPGGSTYSLLTDMRGGARKRVSTVETWCG